MTYKVSYDDEGIASITSKSWEDYSDAKAYADGVTYVLNAKVMKVVSNGIESLNDFSDSADELRMNALFGGADVDTGLTPMAEQQFILALTYLEQAALTFKMADLSQTAALGAARRGGKT